MYTYTKIKFVKWKRHTSWSRYGIISYTYGKQKHALYISNKSLVNQNKSLLHIYTCWCIFNFVSSHCLHLCFFFTFVKDENGWYIFFLNTCQFIFHNLFYILLIYNHIVFHWWYFKMSQNNLVVIFRSLSYWL